MLKTSNQLETRQTTSRSYQILAEQTGFSAMPNLLFDQLRGLLKRNEYDVFMYIARRIFGFHKNQDAISVSQFQHGITTRDGRKLDYGCGVTSRETVQRALRELEQKGFIKRWQSRTSTGANGTNIYSICAEAIIAAVETQAKQLAALEPTTITSDDGDVATEQETNTLIAVADSLPTEPEAENDDQYRPIISLSPAENQPYRIMTQQKQSHKNNTWAAQSVADDLSSKPVIELSARIQLDRTLLSEAGLDTTMALKLALLAEKHGKDDNYVARIVAYGRKTARSNLPGMIRRLIENCEDRTSPRSFSSAKSSRQNWSGWLDEPPPPDDAARNSRVVALPKLPPLTSAASPDPALQRFWQLVLRRLRFITTREQYDSWLRNMDLVALHDQTAVIVAPNANSMRYVKQHLLSQLTRALAEELQRPIEVRLETAS